MAAQACRAERNRAWVGSAWSAFGGAHLRCPWATGAILNLAIPALGAFSRLYLRHGRGSLGDAARRTDDRGAAGEIRGVTTASQVDRGLRAFGADTHRFGRTFCNAVTERRA